MPEHKYENAFFKISESKIWESPKEKLLCLKIDKALKFNEYVFSLCKKEMQKLATECVFAISFDWPIHKFCHFLFRTQKEAQ